MLAHPELFKLRRPFIASMRELIIRYELAIKWRKSKASIEHANRQPCLLCNPLGTKQSQVSQYPHLSNATDFKEACKKLGCPWLVITGKTCDESVGEDEHPCYHSTDPVKQQARINQLKEWIHIYRTYKKEAKDEQES